MDVDTASLLANYVSATLTFFAELIEQNLVQLFELAAILLFVGICKFIARRVYRVY